MAANSVAERRFLRSIFESPANPTHRRFVGVSMDYQVDLDPTHQVLRVTVTAAVLTHELAEECCLSVARIASRGGPYATIWDLSGVTGTTASANDVRSRAYRGPAVSGARVRVLVGKAPVIYGLLRMLELISDCLNEQLQVVWSMEEAYEIVGVRPEDFTERLFPKKMAA
jgi:hypothetical protein